MIAVHPKLRMNARVCCLGTLGCCKWIHTPENKGREAPRRPLDQYPEGPSLLQTFILPPDVRLAPR